MAPKRLSLGTKLKNAKLNDVNKLLTKHFGCDWGQQDSLSFYKNVLEENNHQEDVAEGDDPICEYHEADIAIRV